MVVIKGGWVEKSSGGKKDASSGTVKQGKESWKKRFVAVEDSPVQTLAWYKNEKVSPAAAPPPARAAAPLTRPCARGRHLARARRHRCRSRSSCAAACARWRELSYSGEPLTFFIRHGASRRPLEAGP